MSRPWCIALLLILLLAGALRFYHLGNNSYWHDEFLSLKSSSGQNTTLASLPTNVLIQHPPVLTRLDRSAPWWQLWRVEDGEIHPPLYFILLRFWREAFGDGEAAVRTLSVIASVAALIFFFFAVRVQTCASTALWATALMAVAGPQIYIAQFARDYALWLAIGLAGAWAVLSVEKHGVSVGRLCVLGVCALALPLTHYFGALSVASLGIYALIQLRGGQRKSVIAVLLATTILFLILWGPQMPDQHQPGIEWLGYTGPHPLLSTAERIIQIPLRSISVAGDNLLIAFIFFIAMFFAIVLTWRDRRVLFWLLWFLPLTATIAALDLARQTRMLDVSRYIAVADVSFCALIPIICQRLFRRGWWAIPAVIFLLGLGSVRLAYPWATEWRDVAAGFRQAVQPGDVVVYTGGQWLSWEGLCLFLGISHYAPDLAGSTLLLTDLHAPIVQQLPASGQSIWLVCFQPDLSPDKVFPRGKVVAARLLPNVGWVAQIVGDSKVVD